MIRTMVALAVAGAMIGGTSQAMAAPAKAPAAAKLASPEAAPSRKAKAVAYRAPRAAQIQADISRETKIKGTRSGILSPDLAAGCCNRRFQFKRISIQHNFEIANRISAG